MNFSVLDGYFDVHSSEDTDASNHGSYQPPSTKSNPTVFKKIRLNKEMMILKSESDKIRKQLRHLFKLRSSQHQTISNQISKSYQRMHLRIAQITKQFGEAQLAIINWRILFEQKYLAEIKSLMMHFDSYTNYLHTQQQKAKQFESVSTVAELLEESPSSGDNEADDEKKEQLYDATQIATNKELDDEEEEKVIAIDGINTIKLDQLNSKKHIKSINNSDNALETRSKQKKYPKAVDINMYLKKFRKKLELSMNSEKSDLKTRCKHLRLELNNEEYLQQRQELLVSYEERIAVVLLLFHWFVESNKYELKANVYSRNNIGAQLSAQKVKHYYICNDIIRQIQNKFNCLVLDSRNEIGKQIRIWLKLLATKDMRHLKPQILLKHINCFIRDFIKSHHYIIADIVRHQHGKYNIEYVIQKHESVNEATFKQYITTKTFLCRKTQTKHYYKTPLSAVSLRWSLLRLLQRCLYSRLSIIGVLPRTHSLQNIAKTSLIKLQPMRHKQGYIATAANRAISRDFSLKMNSKCEEEEDYDENIDIDIDDDSDEKYDNKRRKKPMSIAMQMVPLDGRSSMDSSANEEEDIEDDEMKFEHEICSGVDKASKVEYIKFPHKNNNVIQYADASISSYAEIPTFNIYGLPRNSDYEFQLLDEHFFNQCGWMRNLSPFQLGIECIYWCDRPPLMLHANSDILMNVKESDSMDAAPNRSTGRISDNHIADLESASMSDIYGSWKGKKNSLQNETKKTVMLETAEKKRADLLVPPKNAHLYRSYSSKQQRHVLIDDNEYKEDDEFAYDYSVRPFGDALALIECLDELRAPFDMNECLGYVVDVIFRTAQTNRKFNIHKSTKLERYQLDLSSLIHYNNTINDAKDSESDEEEGGVLYKKRKKRRKKKKKKRSSQGSEHLEDSLSNINGEAAIGADVFFPLFIWVIVHSKIRNIHRSVFIMSHYNDSDAMKTKVGYNVSTLHSALDHVMKANKKLYIGQNSKFRR